MITLTVKPEREQDFLKLLRQMKERVVHQDHGNIVYELFAQGPARRPGAAGQAAAQGTQHQYVFLEEWRNQAAATAHGTWAGPIVRTQWREMTDSMQIVPLDRVSLR
jgi:quinol monooxygenase YgiN